LRELNPMFRAATMARIQGPTAGITVVGIIPTFTLGITTVIVREVLHIKGEPDALWTIARAVP